MPFTKAFLQGWLQPLTLYGNWGVSALPMIGLGDAPVMFFMLIVMAYLSVIGYAVIKWLRSTASKGEIFLAVVAAYGLLLLLQFVNRSHPYNLCHIAVPFAIVVTALIYKCNQWLLPWLRQSSFPFIWTGGIILVLLTAPTFWAYPSLLASFFTTAPQGGLALLSSPTDVSGLPADKEGLINEFHCVVSEMQNVAHDGGEVAVLDVDGANLCHAANLNPWSRYGMLFDMCLTSNMVEDVKHDLIDRAPRWVVIKSQNSPRLQCWEFIWTPLYQIVKDRYELYQTIGSFEIWEHQSLGQLESLARSGDAQAQFKLGKHYLTGAGVAVNPTNALELFFKAADQGLADAQCQIGVCYFQGLGVTKDYAASISWLHKADAQGNTDAQYNLGLLYENGFGVKQDLAEAALWYQRAGEKGHVLSQNSLGLINFNQENYVEAAQWFHKAAEQGNARAQNSLGIIYQQGLGVKSDSNAALKWFQLSAGQGLAESQRNLGLIYIGAHHFEEAAQWFHKAADQGHAAAQYNIAKLYQQGVVYHQDLGEATLWFTRSAKQGFGSSQLALGKIYHDGQGVTVDDIEAYKWFKLAQLQGVTDADNKLTNCAAAMSKEQIDAAEKQVIQLQNSK